ncbi:MAG: hypothetical protein GWP08_20295 [Nitrospiraceae bacterium]|nr:hypothetical protein [Nitrospiraceae bacterium]
MRIYVASSWRCPNQPRVVRLLRQEGYEVYDFRNPLMGNKCFHWSEIDPDWESWTPALYRERLSHPFVEQGFHADFHAMRGADLCVGVQPFGRSASLELGWFIGAGKPTILYLSSGEPELMVKMCSRIVCTDDELLSAIPSLPRQTRR